MLASTPRFEKRVEGAEGVFLLLVFAPLLVLKHPSISIGPSFLDRGVTEIQFKIFLSFFFSFQLLSMHAISPDSRISAEKLTSIIYGLQDVLSLQSNPVLDLFSEEFK